MQQPQLNYAPPKSSEARRWLRRRAAPLAATIVAVVAAVWLGPRFARNVDLLRRQRAATAFVPPAGYVTSHSQYIRITSNQPDAWGSFIAAAEIPAAPAAFLGELSGKDGRRRVVVIGAWITHRPLLRSGSEPPPAADASAFDVGLEQIMLSAHVLRPGTFTSPPAYARRDRVAFAAAVPAGPEVRVFAGRRDPSDPSRFTIEYQSGSTRGVIEGRLRHDDSIGFTLLSGPATQTAP
jgi:hypothetical protein